MLVRNKPQTHAQVLQPVSPGHQSDFGSTVWQDRSRSVGSTRLRVSSHTIRSRPKRPRNSPRRHTQVQAPGSQFSHHGYLGTDPALSDEGGSPFNARCTAVHWPAPGLAAVSKYRRPLSHTVADAGRSYRPTSSDLAARVSLPQLRCAGSCRHSRLHTGPQTGRRNRTPSPSPSRIANHHAT